MNTELRLIQIENKVADLEKRLAKLAELDAAVAKIENALCLKRRPPQKTEIGCPPLKEPIWDGAHKSPVPTKPD